MIFDHEIIIKITQRKGFLNSLINVLKFVSVFLGSQCSHVLNGDLFMQNNNGDLCNNPIYFHKFLILNIYK